MISSIRLSSFKGHRETRMPLGRLTVLVGPNGAGKTSVLQALELLTRLVRESPKQVLRGNLSPWDLLQRGSPGPVAVVAEGKAGDGPWRLSLEVPVSEKDSGLFQSQPTVAWNFGGTAHIRQNVDRPLADLWSDARFAQTIGPAMLYRFDARRIAEAAYSGDENPTVNEDGGNTAVVLAALKLEQEEVFERIEAELRKIVPNLQRIRVKRVKMPRETAAHPSAEAWVGNKIFLDFKGASDVPAHAASEGTLITLALLTALCSPMRPRLLLLDDIDHSLHPQAQMHLMRELKRLLEEFPEVQLVATTHSPYILDELEPSDVRVFALRPDGSVACRSLSEHPQAEKMKGVLTSGQLWSLDPEWRWVVGEG